MKAAEGKMENFLFGLSETLLQGKKFLFITVIIFGKKVEVNVGVKIAKKIFFDIFCIFQKKLCIEKSDDAEVP